MSESEGGMPKRKTADLASALTDFLQNWNDQPEQQQTRQIVCRARWKKIKIEEKRSPKTGTPVLPNDCWNF